MKAFGFCPVYKTPNKKNFIIPFIKCLFHIICITVSVRYISRTPYLQQITFGTILFYVNFIVKEMFFMEMFLAISNKSWRILLETMANYPKTDKKFSLKVIFIILNLSYLLIVTMESYNRDVSDNECTIFWLYLIGVHYLTYLYLYFLIEFFVMLEQFYKDIHLMLTENYRQFAETKQDDFQGTQINSQFVQTIKQKYFKNFYVLQNYNDVFGWPICFLLLGYTLDILLKLRFVLYVSWQYNILYKITTMFQIIVPSVSNYFFL